MSTKNGAKDETTNELTADAVFTTWMREGGIDLTVDRVVELRALVTETVTAMRAQAKRAEEEIRAKTKAMEEKFAALGGVPPLDDAEVAKAKAAGVKVKPTAPADDATFRAALVQRILVLRRDRPKDDPPTTRGLARWSGATGQRVEFVLSGAPEVIETSDGRWLPREA